MYHLQHLHLSSTHDTWMYTTGVTDELNDKATVDKGIIKLIHLFLKK